MEKIYSGREIPGMIEPIEQALLETLAKNIKFDNDECVVEFGTFFGRSTACISAGLKANPSFLNNSKFYAYDSFECDLSGGFYSHVLSHAKSGNIEALLRIVENKANFFNIFQNYLDYYIKKGVLLPVKEELKNSFPANGIIRLMHIDSPKFYDDFKFILYRFFPHLRAGSIIVFQDFFYHWSATLIAVCGLMFKKGLLTIENSAASSLVCKVTQTIDSSQIKEIDLGMSIENIVPELIDFLNEHLENIDLDRRNIFQPRLNLAKIQWFFEIGKHESAAEEIASFFNQGNSMNISLANDFIELMRFGFSIKKLYNKDHS